MDYDIVDIGLPMESTSGYSDIDTLTNVTSNTETFPPLVTPQNVHNPQVSVGFTSGINEGALRSESFVAGIRGPLDAASLTTFPLSFTLANALYMPPKSASLGPDDLGPPPVTSNQGSICNWCQEGMSVPPEQSHQCIRVNQSNDSIHSTHPWIPSVPANGQCQEQSESHDWPQQTGEGPAAPSLPSPRQTAGDKYPCNICGEEFTQSQVALRHMREQHQYPKFKLCEYCGTFEWKRRYKYTAHLKSCQSYAVHFSTGSDER